jgi:hypothetical protein
MFIFLGDIHDHKVFIDPEFIIRHIDANDAKCRE